MAYGRVVPAKVVDHLKLLGNTGFEQFPYWFDKQTRKPFTEYLFVIQGGKDEIISMGKEIVEFANKASWSIIDSTNLTISNNLIEVGYGPDKMVEQNRLSGLSFFKYKPSGLNLAEVLDAYGYGYARYYSGGPSRYEVSHIDSNYLEVTISVRSQNGNRVVVQKQERIFRNLAVLEIEYSKLDLLWWEDFYSTEREEKRVYTIYGVNKEITQQMHKAFRKKAEEDCGHNFGDCYLRAAGSDTLKSMYKGFVIFGFYDTITNTGLGFVLPASMGLHNGFKLWSMHNYESFPFYHMQQKLPLRRWIFATEKGREGILSMGKAIADLQSKNKSIFSNIESLENF